MTAAILLAAACVCPPAPRQYDWSGVDAALAILARNRAAFERGER